MSPECQQMYSEFVQDGLTEAAIQAAARLARHLGNDQRADKAWQAVYLLKALRRADVVAGMDAERLERAIGQRGEAA